MKDRQVEHPMRYRDKRTGKILELEPLHGEIIEAGTPLNKATFFSDSTAALLELGGNDALPDKAFDRLARAVKMDGAVMSALGVTGGSFALQEAIKSLATFKAHNVGYFTELRGSDLAGWGSSGDGSIAQPLSFAKRYRSTSGESTHNSPNLELAPRRSGFPPYHVLVRVRASYTMLLTSGTIEPRSFRLLKDGVKVTDFGSNLVCEGYYPADPYSNTRVFRQTYTASLNYVVEVSNIVNSTLLTLGLIDSGSWGNSLKIERGCIEEFAALIID